MEKVITNTNFKEVLASSKVVVIDFWATWCGPCKALSPTVEEIAAEYEGKAVVAKCNIDDAEDVAMECRIRNIPTLLFYKDGELADRSVGLLSKAEIKARIDKLL